MNHYQLAGLMFGREDVALAGLTAKATQDIAAFLGYDEYGCEDYDFNAAMPSPISMAGSQLDWLRSTLAERGSPATAHMFGDYIFLALYAPHAADIVLATDALRSASVRGQPQVFEQGDGLIICQESLAS